MAHDLQAGIEEIQQKIVATLGIFTKLNDRERQFVNKATDVLLKEI